MEADPSTPHDTLMNHYKEGLDLQKRYNIVADLATAMDRVDMLADQLKDQAHWTCSCEKRAYHRSPQWLQEQPLDLAPQALRPRWFWPPRYHG
ncbi:hypothetical protein PHYSODRAFT_534633 [Phytophthora sojae]|uniref:Uncharacterized protein n=3 Tax=Phytophthora sojae (strain P6497) TaxID=1094619 RepID=G4YLS9_PHYSP|nr:hypothetical protein PHYSODRAFT_466559 [Phytophthora sojae]XP_009514097.1 hypothetical protein PHYSODRAFT_476106 [Phytophthora sojae]XP_009514107.1 hypothetical protein PHYSODRAFT_470930 [Phytophthora sojae]XP_009530347.1 hypothetical protein PHYSODRAFT_513826 [Phytophthora sojae]XP_009539359.1 hypothetical protein PHYSODRAFT_534578 [Phytophthora sojae]XP_009539394.1 hypothetical protein PHYSODRAFT_534633 [Phytophthora sojae]EGZ05201.1 hypothetical protein PHYSODRAFT_534578 [Phytophthora s|eukprot:XP_009513974.1 hypothetical protein PHYSODRAFT_466559 [Phytophthora sojae]